MVTGIEIAGVVASALKIAETVRKKALAIRKLLTDGCESPLYNRDIHMSELRAALYYLRRDPQVRAQPRPVTPAAPGSLR